MKKILKRIGLGFLIAFTLFNALFVVPSFANIVMPWNRADAIEAALHWGGLDELPESADVIAVGTKGSAFTREFLIEFTCDKKDLEIWMQRSNLNNIKPVEGEGETKVYQVPGANGAIGGWVFIDPTTNNVLIDMSWS